MTQTPSPSSTPAPGSAHASASPGSALEQFLPHQTQDALAHLEFVARRTVDGMLHGSHASRRLGVSTDFDHHKNYQPGDPGKHIDWKVSARHDRLYVKRYVEDITLTVRLIVDRSASMRRATANGPSKDLQACRLAACLAYLTINQRDQVGMVVAREGEPFALPPGSTQKHLVQLLVAMLNTPPIGSDDLERCLNTMVQRTERKGLVIVISDFMFDPQPVQAKLGQLLVQGHEVLCVTVRDPDEQDFPFNRWVEFADLERPGSRHRIDATALKRIYLQEYAALTEQWDAWARKHGVHQIALRSDEPIESALNTYFHQRSGNSRG